MSENIISALIGIIPTIIVAVFSIVSNNQVIKIRIDELEKKVEKHNQIVERMYKAESDIKVLQEESKGAIK
jgi:proteasome assembly chaperone (PAC2) family protein